MIDKIKDRIKALLDKALRNRETNQPELLNEADACMQVIRNLCAKYSLNYDEAIQSAKRDLRHDGQRHVVVGKIEREKFSRLDFTALQNLAVAVSNLVVCRIVLSGEDLLIFAVETHDAILFTEVLDTVYGQAMLFFDNLPNHDKRDIQQYVIGFSIGIIDALKRKDTTESHESHDNTPDNARPSNSKPESGNHTSAQSTVALTLTGEDNRKLQAKYDVLAEALNRIARPKRSIYADTDDSKPKTAKDVLSFIDGIHDGRNRNNRMQ